MEDSGRKECDSCGSTPFKYRCPECSRLSCSVSCVKKHKIEHGCSGLRCKTKYVPLNEFTDSHLYSDYYFLEDVGRCVDSVHRQHMYDKREFGDSNEAERRFHWLQRKAVQRNIKLCLLPQGMSRHRMNTSRTVRVSCGERTNRKSGTKEWEIRWHLQLLFPQADMEFHEDNISEKMLLCELLERYIHPVSSDPIVRHQLSQYVESSTSVEVVMEDGTQPSMHRLKYHRLGKNLSLRENFIGKTIIEFPKLVILLGTHLADYCLAVKEESSLEATEAVPDCTMASCGTMGTDKSKPRDVCLCPVKAEPQHTSGVEVEQEASGLTLIAQSYSSDSSVSDV